MVYSTILFLQCTAIPCPLYDLQTAVHAPSLIWNGVHNFTNLIFLFYINQSHFQWVVC